MRRRHLLTTSLLAAAISSSSQAAFIYTNTSNLLPNTPNQVIKVYVSGNDIIQGENLDFQINTGASGPFFTGVDIVTGTIFAASNTGQTVPNDPAYNAQGILSSGTAAGHLAVDLTTTVSPAVTTDNGLLATLLVTTTASTGTLFSLTMLNTLNRSSNFGTGGNNTISFSTPHTLFSIASTPARQWQTNGGGTWDSDPNWTPFAPYAQGDIANFLGAATSGTAVVTLNGVRTVGTVNFNNAAASYDVQSGSGGSLLLDNGTQATAPVIAVLAGQHIIEAPIALAAATSVSVAAGSSLTISGAISGGGTALSLSGGGKLIVTSSANSYGTTNIAAGSWLQVGNGATPGSFGTGAISVAGTLTISNLAQPLAVPMSGNGPVIIDGFFDLNTTSTAANWIVSSTGNLQVGNGGASGLLFGATVTNSGMIGFNRIDSAVDTAAITGTGTLTQLGAGTTSLASPVNYSGPTILSAGKLVFSGGVTHAIARISGAGSMQVDPGTTLTSDGVVLAPSGVLTINGTHTLRSSASGGAYTTFALGNSAAALSGTSEVSSLVFGSSGILDIRNNALIVEATAGTKAGLIQQIAVDLGTHITSSTAATNPNYGVVVADNADLGATTFGGLAVDANSIIVTQALLGDANLDGVVNPTDLLIWAHNFNNAGSYSVASGDLNNDGVVNPTDLLIWAHAFNNSIGGGAPSGGGGTLGGDGLSGVSPVPEPASVLLLGLGAIGLLTRRRRGETSSGVS